MLHVQAEQTGAVLVKVLQGTLDDLFIAGVAVVEMAWSMAKAVS